MGNSCSDQDFRAPRYFSLMSGTGPASCRNAGEENAEVTGYDSSVKSLLLNGEPFFQTISNSMRIACGECACCVVEIPYTVPKDSAEQ